MKQTVYLLNYITTTSPTQLIQRLSATFDDSFCLASYCSLIKVGKIIIVIDCNYNCSFQKFLAKLQLFVLFEGCKLKQNNIYTNFINFNQIS